MTTFAGLCLSVALYCGGDFLLSLLGASQGATVCAQDYLLGLAPRPPAYFLDYLLPCVLMIEGESRLCIRAGLMQLVLFVLLSLCFCPLWGLLGVSLSGTVSLLVVVLLKYSRIRLRLPSPKFYFSLKRARTVFSFSVPSALAPLFTMALTTFFTAYILREFDQETLVIYALILKLFTLGVSIADAVTEALQPMICLYYAEQNLVGVKRIMELALKWGLVLESLLLLVFLVFPEEMVDFLGINTPTDQEKNAIMTALLGLPFFAYVHIFTYYYVYIHRRRYGVVLQALLLLVFPLTFMLSLSKISGSPGLWQGMVVAPVALWLLLSVILGRNLLLLDERRLSSQIAYDFSSDPREVVAASEAIRLELLKRGVTELKANRVALFVEELSLEVGESTEKLVSIEATVEVQGQKVRLIIRDTGEHRDNTDANEAPLSFRNYFITQVATHIEKESYFLVGRFNRIVINI